MSTQCLSVPIRAGRTDRLEAWIGSLGDRRDEVLAALADEGIRAEAVVLVRSRTPDEPDHLQILVDAVDLEAASAAFRTSTHAVDVEFRELMGECLDLAGARPLDVLLFEVRDT